MNGKSGFLGGSFEKAGEALKSVVKTAQNQTKDATRIVSQQIGLPTSINSAQLRETSTQESSQIENNASSQNPRSQQASQTGANLSLNTSSDQSRIESLKKQLELEAHKKDYFDKTFVSGVDDIRQIREEEYQKRTQEQTQESSTNLSELSPKQQKEELIQKVFRTRREGESKGVQG